MQPYKQEQQTWVVCCVLCVVCCVLCCVFCFKHIFYQNFYFSPNCASLLFLLCSWWRMAKSKQIIIYNKCWRIQYILQNFFLFLLLNMSFPANKLQLRLRDETAWFNVQIWNGTPLSNWSALVSWWMEDVFEADRKWNGQRCWFRETEDMLSNDSA